MQKVMNNFNGYFVFGLTKMHLLHYKFPQCTINASKGNFLSFNLFECKCLFCFYQLHLITAHTQPCSPHCGFKPEKMDFAGLQWLLMRPCMCKLFMAGQWANWEMCKQQRNKECLVCCICETEDKNAAYSFNISCSPDLSPNSSCGWTFNWRYQR